MSCLAENGQGFQGYRDGSVESLRQLLTALRRSSTLINQPDAPRIDPVLVFTRTELMMMNDPEWWN
jgi:hypothetical protein